MILTEKEQLARGRVCLALDNISSVKGARALSIELKSLVGMVKVGKELYTVAGNEGRDIVGELRTSGMSSFLDLKFHDTPNTVYQASKAAASASGVYMFNLHVAGGKEMCKKAIEGAYDGAKTKKIERPKVIGVTVLTSLDDGDLAVQGLGISFDDLVRRRTELAREWGLDGIVCPANKAGKLEKEFGSDFLYVTPGVQYGGRSGKGQKQFYTPDQAVEDCSSSILVIGSAITNAGNVTREGKLFRGTFQDRKTAAYGILQSMAEKL